jgi:Kef-type K+ transport system membrane component KefB
MSLLTTLLVLVVVARLLGKLFARYNQPEVVGEILAGIILGPAMLNAIHPSPSLAGISELAVFLVILSAGLGMRFDEVAAAMRGRGLLLAIVSFMIPFAGGAAVAAYYDLDAMRIVFLGLCVAITALPVAVKMLDSLQILDTPIGRYSIATAILNDIAALLLLGVILTLPPQPTVLAVSGALLIGSAKALALGAIVLGLNRWLRHLEVGGVKTAVIPERLVTLFGSETLFGIVALFVLLFGSISELLGFHFVIGAFFGALLLDKRLFLASHFDDLIRTLNSVTGGFLAPVFFAYLGLKFNFSAIQDVGFIVAVLTVSVITKVVAGWWGGLWVGMSHREAIGLGCMLNGRGMMELIVASIAYEKGFIGAGMFSTLVLMGIVTTLLAPFLFNRAMPESYLKGYRPATSTTK